PLQDFLYSFDSKRASNQLPRDLPTEAVRRLTHLLNWLAELLADLVNDKALTWPKGEMMRWSGSDDGWLAKHLFGDATDAGDRLDALFGTQPITNDEAADRLRATVGDWLAHNVEEARNTPDLRENLMGVLMD